MDLLAGSVPINEMGENRREWILAQLAQDKRLLCLSCSDCPHGCDKIGSSLMVTPRGIEVHFQCPDNHTVGVYTLAPSLDTFREWLGQFPMHNHWTVKHVWGTT